MWTRVRTRAALRGTLRPRSTPSLYLRARRDIRNGMADARRRGTTSMTRTGEYGWEFEIGSSRCHVDGSAVESLRAFKKGQMQHEIMRCCGNENDYGLRLDLSEWAC